MKDEWQLLKDLKNNRQRLVLLVVMIVGTISIISASAYKNHEALLSSYNEEVVESVNMNDESLLDEEVITEEISELEEDTRVYGYKVEIEDGVTVILESIEDVEQVLENVQSHIVEQEILTTVDVNIESSEITTNFKQEIALETLHEERLFTAVGIDEVSGDVIVDENVIIEADDNTEEHIFLAEENAEEEISEEEVVSEQLSHLDGEILKVDFVEDIKITEVYVPENEISDVKEATNVLTKEEEAPDIYTVVSGDVPSIIAETNDMSLSQLYSLNQWLEGNEKSLQIGDELVVLVPEPELSVITEEVSVYNEKIEKGYTYVDDPDSYIGLSKTVEEGEDGVALVSAVVTKINGIETDRIVSEEVILEEAKDKIIAKGSKAYPTKETLGSFSYPLISYTVTSGFGYRWGSFHQGVDLAASYGTSVMAAEDGIVTYSGWYSTYGYLVEISHGGGVTTRYGHNSELLVSEGDEVSEGQIIAKVGSTGQSTGPHVHFEIRLNDVCLNPMNYLQ